MTVAMEYRASYALMLGVVATVAVASSARHALEVGVELGGEILEVTVMFADLVGSTALAESRPPTEVVTLLNELFEIIVTAVEAENGWVDKFVGDGAVCVFGAPSPRPDHARCGLRAARRLALSASGRGLALGIGVASGSAVAGNIGSAARFEYTVIGPPVNQAARLSELAKGRPGGILVSAGTVAEAADEALHWNPEGHVDLRGIDRPFAVAVPT